jgi:hypothetical protein
MSDTIGGGKRDEANLPVGTSDSQVLGGLVVGVDVNGVVSHLV